MAFVERTAITVKIPVDLHASLVSAVNKGVYQNTTSGVVTALDHDLNGTVTADIQEMGDELQKLNSVIQSQAFELQKQAIELSGLHATCTGLQQVIEEKNSRIADLTREVETLSVLAHYFKTAEPKQIEAPEAKKPWWKFW